MRSGSEPKSSVVMETSSAVCISEEITKERGPCKSTQACEGLYKAQMCDTAYTEQMSALQPRAFISFGQ